MDDEITVSGHAFLNESLEARPVTITVKSGIITHIEDESHPPDYWIVPAFFNAHTHLGDTIAMDVKAEGDLASLVTPPGGLKHRLLAEASREALVSGMRSSILSMTRGGCAGCADFREGGPEGVAALKDACSGLMPSVIIFGRQGGELAADGLGVSSARDAPDFEQQVEIARRNGKMVAFHAGERDPEDIDAALAFDPDLIVHCTHATRRQLRECADRDIPIAVCPRSNWALGVTKSSSRPPIRTMTDLGCRLFLGTDNVMFNSPDLFAEMAFTHNIYNTPPGVLVRAAIEGSLLSGDPFFIRQGRKARFFVIDPGHSSMRFSHDNLSTLVKRARSDGIVKKIFIL